MRQRSSERADQRLRFAERFGFEPASKHGLVSQWKGMPDAAFMVLVLDVDAVAGVSGVARYRDEFDEVT